MTHLILPIFIASWLGFLALRAALFLVGWLVVPVAVLFGAYEMRDSRIYPERQVRAFTWPIMWLWGNEEEGIGFYGESPSVNVRIIYSECLRNPVNNLRYVPLLALKIEPKKVRFVGSLGGNKDVLPTDVVKSYDLDATDFWSLTWHGLHSNIRWQGKIGNTRYRFWLGWKIYPEDIYGIPEWSHRSATVGFATQFRRLK